MPAAWSLDGTSSTVRPGQRFSGRVLSGGEPEPYVVIEVRDEGDQILGIGLTGDNGTFSVPVDLEGVD